MSHRGHPYSASGAWLLDSWLRRRIQPPDKLVEKLTLTSEQTAVDFGCGPGYYTLELAKRAGKVVAVDIQPEMLQLAQRKIAKAGVSNVEFLQSDGTKIALPDGSVDLILLVTVFHEIGNVAAVLGEFGRILKPAGRLAIVEITEKGFIPTAPVQNPAQVQAEVEAEGYQLQRTQPQNHFSIFTFSKKQQ